MAPEAPAAFAAVAARLVAPRSQGEAAPRRRSAATPRSRSPRQSGAVVQLGAYRSPKHVAAAWNQLTERYPALRAYLPMSARFDSPKGTFYRLSVKGFGNQREAIARCQLLKRRGGTASFAVSPATRRSSSRRAKRAPPASSSRQAIRTATPIST